MSWIGSRASKTVIASPKLSRVGLLGPSTSLWGGDRVASPAQVEYVGFAAKGAAREYTLRLRRTAADPLDFTLVIPNEAFLSHRVRYQDAPDVCFLKLQRELLACADGLPARRLGVTDAELQEYRENHAPKPPQRRPKAPPRT